MAENAKKSNYIKEETFIPNESVTLVWGESLGYEDGKTKSGTRFINQTTGAVYSSASCPVYLIKSISDTPNKETDNPLGLISVTFKRVE